MKPESENFTISKVSAEICPSVADHPNTFDIIVLQVKNSVTMTTKTRKQLDHPFCGDCFMNWGSFRQIKRQVEKNGSRHPLNTWMESKSNVSLKWRAKMGGKNYTVYFSRNVYLEIYSSWFWLKNPIAFCTRVNVTVPALYYTHTSF